MLPDNEYEVIAHVLQTEYQSPRHPQGVLEEMTASSTAEGFYSSYLHSLEQREIQPPWVPSEEEEDWMLKNIHEPRLIYRGHAVIRGRFTLLTPQAVEQLLRMSHKRYPHQRDRSWDAFHSLYPQAGSLLTVSRVGFDRGQEQAQIEVSTRIYGHAYRLARGSQARTVTSKKWTWMS
ncbi:hypothetical protein [Deinococcus hopiensis]|uniref:Uncharacterized protein n=1 Tax=Deinococcus hopiensis KR-140 TaxID=695939 RepID=A0A1W1UVS4_9DEIO|nr:hypothetical protein [Deinococcus hopiensis]SMB85150.1 hypothetical protein SAMN00790413_03285 [Deinococcus hopiensis KR-140]